MTIILKQNWKIARVIPTHGGDHFLWLAQQKTAIPRVNCVRQLRVTYLAISVFHNDSFIT